MSEKLDLPFVDVAVGEIAAREAVPFVVSFQLREAICNTRHAGQIEYLRGLVKHRGWFPAAEKK